MATFAALSTSDLMSMYSYPIKMTSARSDGLNSNQPLYPQSTHPIPTPYAYDLCPPIFDGSYLYNDLTPMFTSPQSAMSQRCSYSSTSSNTNMELPNMVPGFQGVSNADLYSHFPELDPSLSENFTLQHNFPQFAPPHSSPEMTTRSRTSRATSLTSNARSVQSSISHSSFSLNNLPCSLSGLESHRARETSQDRELYRLSQRQKHSEMVKYGIQNDDGRWSCAYPSCTSRSVFTRGCDLRKHYKRHAKTLYCRYEGCPQATPRRGGLGGFSSKKDRSRHEAKHDPRVVCEWPDCGRVFSRQDNMKDHVRRVHQRIQDTF